MQKKKLKYFQGNRFLHLGYWTDNKSLDPDIEMKARTKPAENGFILKKKSLRSTL